MELKKLDPHTQDMQKVKQIYLEAFPPKERIPFRFLLRKSRRETVDFLGMYDKNRLVGFSYTVLYEDMAYLLFFAFSCEERNKGYGSAALRLLLERYAGKRFFLALEQLDDAADNTAQRIARRRFYERCGLKDLPFVLKESSVTYDVMGTAGTLSPQEYDLLSRDFFGYLLWRTSSTRLVAR